MEKPKMPRFSGDVREVTVFFEMTLSMLLNLDTVNEMQ
jgi:hypothetical protein